MPTRHFDRLDLDIREGEEANRTACPATAGEPPAEFDPMKAQPRLRE